MGQIPNKKYHVSDDGKVFRVNEDGSFTEMGNIEESFAEKNRTTPETTNSIPPSPPNFDPDNYKENYNDYEEEEEPRKSKKWLWILLILIIAGGGLALLVLPNLMGNYNKGYYQNDNYLINNSGDNSIQMEDTIAPAAAEEAVWDYPTPAEAAEETEAAPAEAEEAPAEEAEAAAWFGNYEGRTYEYGSYYYIYFYDNGQCDIYYANGDYLDSGSYYPGGDYIAFNNFNAWPNESVSLYPNDSFYYNGCTFYRY